jgi:hypothetical protein
MARVLPGSAPQVIEQAQPDLALASAWIEDHYDELRGQWVAVRLDQPTLIASAPTLARLWQAAPPAQLKDCLIHYVLTVAEEHQAQGPWWEP